MEDYKEEIRNLLLKYYWNAGQEHKKIQKTTVEILQHVRGVIPSEPISEHDIYEVMKDMQFEQELLILKERICIVEENKEKGIKAEFDTVETGRLFVWNLFEK